MIRFQRIGRKNDPAFRIVVTEKTASPKAGTYVDLVGSYNPRTKATRLNSEAITAWIAKGAQVSDSLHNLLVKEGVIDAPKTAAVVSKSNLEKNIAKKKAEEEAAAAKAAEEAAKAEAAAKAAKEEATASADEEAPATEEETVPEEKEEVSTEDSAADASSEKAEEEAPAAV